MFRPPVVARPLPDPKDLFQGSRGQGLQGGKALQKAAVIGEGLLHPGLLQKDLGDQDAVRVLLPRQGRGRAFSRYQARRAFRQASTARGEGAPGRGACAPP